MRLALGIVLGGVAGYGWYRVARCPDGTCPLLRNPWIATIYGMVLGGLIAASF